MKCICLCGPLTSHSLFHFYLSESKKQLILSHVHWLLIRPKSVHKLSLLSEGYLILLVCIMKVEPAHNCSCTVHCIMKYKNNGPLHMPTINSHCVLNEKHSDKDLGGSSCMVKMRPKLPLHGTAKK